MSTATQIFRADDHALLAAVLDETHDCIKLLDADGRIVFVNRRGAEAMELRAPAELVGRAWIDRWPPEARPSVQAALDHARLGEKAGFQAKRSRPDGSPSWWDVTVAPVRSPEGKLTHFLTIARDTTPAMIEQDRVRAISAEMRHRLKNALTIAGALVNLGARGRPELEAFAADITQRFARLAAVQALILDPATRKDFPTIVEMLASVYGDGAQLEFGRIPDVELGDAALQALALSFGELCTNSLKYGALRNGGKVRIDAKAAGNLCILTWTEDTEFAGERGGGQGLALIDRIVRATGGSVERNADARSLTVRLSLPLAPQLS